MNPIRYLGISKHRRSGPPTSTYYNIPIEHCYEIFDAIDGYIIALIDITNYSNSVCIKNPLFEPIGVSGDELPLEETRFNSPNIVLQIISHVEDMKPGFVTILEVVDKEVVFFDRCNSIDDIKSDIECKVRDNKIDLVLNENN